MNVSGCSVGWKRMCHRMGSTCGKAAAVAASAASATSATSGAPAEKKDKKRKKVAKKNLKSKKNPKANFKSHAKLVISGVAPVLASLSHFVGEKLGKHSIRQGIPDYIAKDAMDAHARAGQIDKVWQSILTSGGGGTKVL